MPPMPPMRTRVLALTCAAPLAAACGDGTLSGALPDGGELPGDGAVADAGLGRDAGLAPDAGPGVDGGVGDACAGRGDEAFCADADALVICSGDREVARMDCRAGCEAREGDDACAEPDACADAPDGWACGEALGLAPGTRARCEGGRLAEEEACPLGCEAGACVMEDPCVHATLGNGWYCAASLEAGEEGVRYRCVDGATAEMERCAHGCAVQPPGSPDLCAAAPGGWNLPLECGASATVSQGNFSSFSHNGTSAYAFDFSLSRGTPMVAMRAGTVRLVKDDIRPGHPCWTGGGRECANQVNYVVLAHDDGTDTLYLHLNEASVGLGESVGAGERVGLSGGTGWSTGPHAHVQRQERCASWWCQSVALRFDDFPRRDGVPASGDAVTSGNCR